MKTLRAFLLYEIQPDYVEEVEQKSFLCRHFYFKKNDKEDENICGANVVVL